MKFLHTALAVNDLDETIAFYEEVFDFKVKNSGERPEVGVKFVMVENQEGDILEFFEHQKPQQAQQLEKDLMDFSKIGIKHFAFIVDNIEETMVKAVDAGAKIIWNIKKGVTVERIAFIADPNDIPIELVELN